MTNEAKPDEFEVAVKELATGKVVHVVHCGRGEHSAEKVLRGMLINMSDRYCAYVRKVGEP